MSEKAEKSRSTSSLLLAGIAGGIIALAGNAGLQWSGILSSSSDLAVNLATPQDIQRLEAEIASLHIAPPPADLSDQAHKALQTIRTQAQNAASRADDALERSLALAQKIENLPERFQSDDQTIQSLNQKIAALQDHIAGIQSQTQAALASTSNEQSALVEVKTQLDALQEQVKQQANQPGIERMIAAQALSNAINNGSPFTAALDTYLSADPQATTIEMLKPYAGQGIATIAQLSNEFSALADRIVTVANQPASDAGLLEQFKSSALSLVSKRPIGNIEGNDAGAVAARIEYALQNGNLATALEQWQQLPETGKVISKEFQQAMQARFEADNLLTTLINASLKSEHGNAATTPSNSN